MRTAPDAARSVLDAAAGDAFTAGGATLRAQVDAHDRQPTPGGHVR